MTTGPGTLYVVATPIGNLDDISSRACQVLADVAMVAAEDTRRAGQLLTRLGVRNRLVSLHEHNEPERVAELMVALLAGDDVALISDAGTPLVSDPGYRLLAAAREHDLPVSPVPGSCAAVAALSVAGLPSDRFRFEGFLPSRSTARRKRIMELRDCPDTLVLFESVHRIGDALADLAELLGPGRPAALARELTKMHETIYRGSLEEIRRRLAEDPGGGRGEFTLVVGGCSTPVPPADRELDRVLEILLEDLPAGQAASLAARIVGVRRSEAYDRARKQRGR